MKGRVVYTYATTFRTESPTSRDGLYRIVLGPLDRDGIKRILTFTTDTEAAEHFLSRRDRKNFDYQILEILVQEGQEDVLRLDLSRVDPNKVKTVSI